MRGVHRIGDRDDAGRARGSTGRGHALAGQEVDAALYACALPPDAVAEDVELDRARAQIGGDRAMNRARIAEGVGRGGAPVQPVVAVAGSLVDHLWKRHRIAVVHHEQHPADRQVAVVNPQSETESWRWPVPGSAPGRRCRRPRSAGPGGRARKARHRHRLGLARIRDAARERKRHRMGHRQAGHHRLLLRAAIQRRQGGDPALDRRAGAWLDDLDPVNYRGAANLQGRTEW